MKKFINKFIEYIIKDTIISCFDYEFSESDIIYTDDLINKLELKKGIPK